jgi:rubrerythrin
MPDEYISREAALMKLMQDGCSAKNLQSISNMPAADVAEVVHGQWEGEGDGYADGEIVLDVWHCSQCGYCIDDGTDNPDCLPKYCPGCGAKMDGGNDNVSD